MGRAQSHFWGADCFELGSASFEFQVGFEFAYAPGARGTVCLGSSFPFEYLRSCVCVCTEESSWCVQ